jgi:hypothetical protein
MITTSTDVSAALADKQRSAAILARLGYTTETYRPAGWPYPLTVSFDRVTELARIAQAKSRRKEPLTSEDAKAITALTMQRDCYITPDMVWQVASAIAGKAKGSWHCDPFFNVWSYTKDWLVPDPLVLDGHQGRDGLAKNPDDTPAFWVGDSMVNGPHSCSEKWIPLAAMHGRENVVAVVVQVSGQKWLLKYGMQCDVCVEFGRMNYESPPGIPPAKCNPLCSALLMWVPEIRKSRAKYQPVFYKVRNHTGKVHEVLARAGRGGHKTKVIEL